MLIEVESSHTLTPAGSIGNTSVTPAGTIGNKDITPAGTISGTALSVAQLPAHSHGRGTTEIKGYIGDVLTNNVNSASGAIYTSDYVEEAQNFSAGNYHRARIDINFQASKNWSGTSESKGSGSTHNHTFTGTKNTHNHTFTGTAANHNHTFTGTSITINNNPPYRVGYCFIRIA